MCTYVQVHMCADTYACAFAPDYVCFCAYMHMFKYVAGACIYMGICACVCVPAYLCMFMYV